MIEVEAKFYLPNIDAVQHALREQFSTDNGQQLRQTDVYFEHPCRLFDETDEALRIRTVTTVAADGSTRTLAVQLCYKGPRLDTLTKTRRELECELSVASHCSSAVSGVTAENHAAPAAAAQLSSVLLALGFMPAGQVHKTRQQYSVTFADQRVGVAIDQVDQLGAFAELEIVCAEADRVLATQTVLGLAAALGLTMGERRSYLELLRIQGSC